MIGHNRHRESWPGALVMAALVAVLTHVFYWLATGRVAIGLWGP